MNAILKQLQQHAASLPLVLQRELLNYTFYLEQKSHVHDSSVDKDFNWIEGLALDNPMESL